jgi:hypothetical protein
MFLRSILILSSYPCLSLLSGLSPSGFLTKVLNAFIISPMHNTCPSHLICLHIIIIMISGEEYISQSSSLSLHLSYLKILSSTPCYQYLQSVFFLNIRHQVSHSYKITVKIIILYILIFMFLDSKQKDRRFWTTQ